MRVAQLHANSAPYIAQAWREYVTQFTFSVAQVRVWVCCLPVWRELWLDSLDPVTSCYVTVTW